MSAGIGYPNAPATNKISCPLLVPLVIPLALSSILNQAQCSHLEQLSPFHPGWQMITDHPNVCVLPMVGPYKGVCN